MATLLEREATDERDDRLSAAAAKIASEGIAGSAPESPEEASEAPVEQVPLRPVLAAALSSAGAALVIGGIFGSWGARLFGLAVALGGAGLAAWALRSRRPTLAQIAVPVIVAIAATLSVLPGSPSELPDLVREAVDAGRLLRPPVPFDPGWRPLLTVVIGLLAFGAAWIGTAGNKPVLGVALPIPLIALAAITQPEREQVLAGVFAFLPILAGFGVLYGTAGGARSAEGTLQRDFEVRRALRGGSVMVGLAVLLVFAGQLEFLFPEPTVDPDDRPQKPKSVPLSAARDRVLFEVEAPAGFTGPWRTGVLDVYEDDVFKLAGASPERLTEVPTSGALPAESPRAATVEVTLTTRDLGQTAVLPVVPTTSRITFGGGARPKYDPRPGVLRYESGRAPSGLRYTMALPAYPTAAELSAVGRVDRRGLLKAPPPPDAVRKLLTVAPPGPWDRLDFLRKQLLDDITAVGAGSPSEMTARKLQDMLAGSKKATPFEIVAAQAVLASYAGVPSRIGFGFNDLNLEDGVLTVRPRNAAQWLEVRIDGYGWIPLLDVPPKAQASLDNPNDDDARVVPSSDIAVEVFVPVELRNPRLLYEQVRAVLQQIGPVFLLLLAAWIGHPFLYKQLRRRRREQWADARGPRERIAVAYAELRDAATDLSVGDPFATPLEYLSRVVEDREHTELAWLVSRAMYGDLGTEVTDEDAEEAELMAASLRRRLSQAQPLQVRFVAALSKGSLLRPFTDEVPGVTLPKLPKFRRKVTA